MSAFQADDRGSNPLTRFLSHSKYMKKKLTLFIVAIILFIAILSTIYVFINPTRFNDPNKGYNTPEDALLNYPWANQNHSLLSYNGYYYKYYNFIFNVWDLEYSAYETLPGLRVNYRLNATVNGEKVQTFVNVEKSNNQWYVTGAGSGP